MALVMFRCPSTGSNVRRWIEDGPEGSPESFVPMDCPVCAGVHFANRHTSEVFDNGEARGDEPEPDR